MSKVTLEKSQEQYIVDAHGNKTAVILDIELYEQMLEDIHDLAVVAERRSRISPEAFRNRLKSYPDWEKSSQSSLAVKFLEKRRQRLAQMPEVDIQNAEIAFERFKVSINSDRPDDAKLYL